MEEKWYYMAIMLIGCCSMAQGFFDLSCKGKLIKKPERSLLYNFLYDTGALQYELFSIETLKLALIFGPIYGVAHHFDNKVHDHFYSSKLHKNTSHMSKKANKLIQAIPIGIALGYSAFMFNPWSEYLATSARVFASGLVPLELIKKFFKRTLHYDVCLRPECEFFNRHKKYYGGFPSGHMAFMAYEVTYLTLEYGWKAGMPLTILGAGVFAGSIDSNRHFTSQLVVGAGLGVAYGIAAYRVMNCYYGCNNVYCDLVAESDCVGVKVFCTY